MSGKDVLDQSRTEGKDTGCKAVQHKMMQKLLTQQADRLVDLTHFLL